MTMHPRHLAGPALAAFASLALAACADVREPTASLGTASTSVASSTSRVTPDRNPTGDVYVETNDATRNEIVVLHRAANGKLASTKTFATGGRGSGMPRLGSQNPLILSDDGTRLFAVNVGSNEISVFDVTSSGLILVDRVPSGGAAPYSLSLRGRLLYALNEGSMVSGSPANITAFTVSAAGTLTPLSGSTRPLSTAYPAPAQVSFSPDGRSLVVTEKATSRIDTYTLGADGRASAPVVHPSAGETPFGFAFRDDGIVVVTEAHNAAPGAASASSYSLAAGFSLISPSVRDTQTDVCWTVITRDGRYAYITNFGSGTVSSYTLAANGSLTLLEAVAARTAQAQGPRDQDLSKGGDYLYVLDIGFADHATQAVNAFAVGADGHLTKVGSYPLPRFYPAAAGLAAQ